MANITIWAGSPSRILLRMALELRTCDPDEFASFLTATEAAFGDEAKEEDIKRLSPLLEPERVLATFDDETIVGTNAAFAFDVTIPGGRVPAAGVTMVGVLPSHRRRGVLTAMIKRQLEDALGWNEPVAILWASEGAIYQRFGYGLATHQATMSIERDRAAFRTAVSGRSKTRIVPHEEAVKVLPAVYDRVRLETPGMFTRSTLWWENHTLNDLEHDRGGAGPLFRTVLEMDGAPEGYVLYRINSSWGDDGIHKGTLEIVEAVATTPAATRDLWSYIFGVDLVDRVQAWFLQRDHPLKWMLSEPRRLRMTVRDALWLRVVDVIGALEARTYADADRLVFRLDDALCGWNQGAWLLDTTGDNAEVSPTDEDAELRLTAEELGAVYLGGATFGELARAGRIAELEQDTVTRADRIFATDVDPWCPEIF